MFYHFIFIIIKFDILLVYMHNLSIERQLKIDGNIKKKKKNKNYR